MTRGTSTKSASVATATDSSGSDADARASHRVQTFSRNGRHVLDVQAECVLQLETRDDGRDPRGEPGRDRIRDEFDETPEPRESHGGQQTPASSPAVSGPGTP
jgi:hypothetical protein